MENQIQPGRPTVVTDDVTAKLIEAFRLGASDTLACEYAQIDTSTLYRHLESDPDFATKVKSSKIYIEILARSNIVKEIENGDSKISQWWLERRARSEFGSNTKEPIVDTSKPPYGSPGWSPYQDWTDEQLDRRLQEMFKETELPAL